jgi:hypothetical protein
MRKSWTDERLDDFAAHTYRRFDGVDKRFEALERRMEDGFNRVDADLRELRGEMNARFERVEERIDDITAPSCSSAAVRWSPSPSASPA